MGQSLNTPTEFGDAIRDARKLSGLTQSELAVAAGVSRKLIVELEGGHARAELGRTLRILDTLGITVRGEHSPAQTNIRMLIDSEISAIRAELAKGDIEFAFRLITDLLTKIRHEFSQATSLPLKRPSSTGNQEIDTFIQAGIRWAMGSGPTSSKPWPAPVPLPEPWIAYGFRKMSANWKELSIRETPQEFAQANVYIRERSLTSI